MRIITTLLLVSIFFTAGCIDVEYETKQRVKFSFLPEIQEEEHPSIIESDYPHNTNPKVEYVYVKVPQRPKTNFASFNN